jgi:hypothetical protein
MRFNRTVAASIAAAALFGGVRFGSAEVVYDNSSDPSGFDYESPNEYGDQVILAGTARVVTEIQIEYYASYTPHGNELARVRFYANTGPFWQGNTDYPTPAATPLYEETFAPGQGYKAAVISVPNVLVPDTFTWTIQFLGIPQTDTDFAGLLFYSVPTVGQSADDFWELTTTGWGAAFDPSVPKNNFGAQITAIQATTGPTLTITRVNNNIQIVWPSAETGFTLEYKNDLNAASWTTVPTAPVVNGANFQVTLPVGTFNQIFRLRSP